MRSSSLTYIFMKGALTDHMENYTKIIAVDFDGTLCIGDRWPNIGEPNQVVIDYILAERERGAKLILWTNRCGEPLQNAIDWCTERGIIFDAVNDNIPETREWFTDADKSRKIFAHEYLDDRAKNPGYCAALYGDNKLQAFVQGRNDALELSAADEVHFPNGDIWKKYAKDRNRR